MTSYMIEFELIGWAMNLTINFENEGSWGLGGEMFF